MNRNFIIATDSTSDLPVDFINENQIKILYLGYFLEGKTYTDKPGIGLSSKEFYTRLRSGAMPTTYQINSETAKEFFLKLLEEGRDVLFIAFSSALSGSCESCKQAAAGVNKAQSKNKVIVVDSISASMGEGLLVYYAVQKAEECLDIGKTAAYVEDLKKNLCHYFTVDSLFHLHRGGRVSKMSAIIGTLLGIKPFLTCNGEGKLIPVAKIKGRKKALTALADKYEERSKNFKNDIIFISHADSLEDAEFVRGLFVSRFKFAAEKIMIGDIDTVIGSHCGADTVSLFFLGENRE